MTPSRDRIIRALLGATAQVPTWVVHPPRRALESSYALHKQTGVAYSWVHKTLSTLDAHDLIRFQADERIKVLDPKGLFDWWADHHAAPARATLHAGLPLQELDELLRADIPTAVTTYYAGDFYGAPLFHRRLDIYVDPSRFTEARNLLLHSNSLLGGNSLRLIEDKSQVILEAIEVPSDSIHFMIVPLPQVILDLKNEGGAAGEAAEILMERAYPFQHPSTKTY